MYIESMLVYICMILSRLHGYFHFNLQGFFFLMNNELHVQVLIVTIVTNYRKFVAKGKTQQQLFDIFFITNLLIVKNSRSF